MKNNNKHKLTPLHQILDEKTESESDFANAAVKMRNLLPPTVIKCIGEKQEKSLNEVLNNIKNFNDKTSKIVEITRNFFELAIQDCKNCETRKSCKHNNFGER